MLVTLPLKGDINWKKIYKLNIHEQKLYNICIVIDASAVKMASKFLLIMEILTKH